MNLIVKDTLIIPMTAGSGEPRVIHGSVAVRGNRIAWVSDDLRVVEKFRRECGDDLRIVDGRGKLLMPGLINTHCHVPMALMRGFADDIPLMEWLNDHIWPFESRLTRDDVEVGARLGIAEMLLGGVTTFVDMYWHEEAVADAVRDMGIRAVLAPSFVDVRMEAFERDVEATAAKCAVCDRLTLMMGPHAPYSCSEENLRRGAELARKYDTGITIHLAETLDEDRTVSERYGMSPVAFADSLGLLGPRTIAAHGIHLSDEDMEILRSRGVTVAHNPHSNMKISSGTAPVVRLLERGVNVAVATDGPCSNNDLDMWDEMRTAAFLQKLSAGDPCVLPAYEVLKLGTVNGARALGREGELGVIAPGALADFVLLDIETPRFYPRNDMAAHIVYCANCGDVDTTVVDGEILVEGGRLVREDVAALCRKAEAISMELATDRA